MVYKRLPAGERAVRDQKVMTLFLSGDSYRAIAAAVGLTSAGVHKIVQRELAASGARRDLLTDEAFAIWQERTEALLNAHWDRALGGDHRSAEVCIKLLGLQARVYRLEADVGSMPAPTPTQPVEGEQAPQDELERLRARRAGDVLTINPRAD
jgi:hypothetical protein